VITQLGTKTTFDIHDPVFIEKINQMMPEEIDRYGAWGPVGIHVFGMMTIADEVTTDKVYMAYWA